MLLVSVCLLLAPAARAQNTILNSTSESIFDIVTYNTTSVTQQVNNYQVELKARMQGGAYLFDQTYSAALSSSTVQAAITQAQNVLSGAGAVSFTGPTQLSSNQSLVSSLVNTVQTGQVDQTPIVSIATYIGPITLTIGNFGICTGYTLTGPQNRPVPTGCTGGTATPLVVIAGGEDIDTFVIAPVTINQTATTTNTYLISQVYEIDGYPAGVPATPAPPTLLLLLIGLACAGLYAARRRLRSDQ